MTGFKYANTKICENSTLLSLYNLKQCCLFRALTRNNEHMGKRYVEVFESKRSEMEWSCKREGGNADEKDDRVVRLRGLPYGCSKEEVANFFKGIFSLGFMRIEIRHLCFKKQNF